MGKIDGESSDECDEFVDHIIHIGLWWDGDNQGLVTMVGNVLLAEFKWAMKI